MTTLAAPNTETEPNYLALVRRAALRARTDASRETRPAVKAFLKRQANALEELWNDGFYFKLGGASND